MNRSQVAYYDHASEWARRKRPIDRAIRRVLASGTYMGGREAGAFEEEFAAWLGVAHCVTTGSCRDALARALLAVGVRRGDEVITVSNTCIGGVMPITRIGATIRWIDIEEAFCTVDAQRLAGCVGEKTKAIIATHMYGHPCDMDVIMGVAGRFGLAVVEDAALALGATYRGRKAGTIGHVGCFSHAASKILATIGTGGAAVTNDGDVAKRMRELSTYSRLPITLQLPDGQELSAGSHYEREGDSSRMSELAAAVLRVRLAHLEEDLTARRDAARQYAKELDGLDLVLPREALHAEHVYRNYTVRVGQRDALRAALMRAGVETAVFYSPPLHTQPVYRGRTAGEHELATTERVDSELVNLPIYPGIPGRAISHVCSAIRDALRERKR